MTTMLKGDIFNLAAVVLDVARENPTRTAVIEPDGVGADGKRRYKSYTYEQLSRDAEAIAPGLREAGIAEKTRIVCMTPPSYEACVLGLGLQRVGATTLWIDPSVGYLNVGERLRRLKPEAFAGIPVAHLGRIAFGWGPRFPKKTIVINGFFPGAHTVSSLKRTPPAEPPQPNVTPDDPAAVLYTTGSTGPAKPTLYLHRNYSQLYRIVHESWRFDSDREIPVDMAVFPAFFFIALSAGGTMVVPPIDFPRETPAKADPRALLDVINDCGVHSCFGSPVLLENMARYAVAHGIKTPSFNRVIGGGAPIFGPVKKALLEMMGPEAQVVSNYGATEALPSTEMGAQEALAETWPMTQQGAGICVGRPFTGVELRIVEMSDGIIERLEQTRPLEAGAIGEILIKSTHVSPAYLDDPESTRKNKIYGPEGEIWHRIGDAGYFDAKGRLWYCGRVSQRVQGKTGPHFSLNCEPIFDAHPAVRRSGLVGVPHADAEEPVICVELRKEYKSQENSIRNELRALALQHPATQEIWQILFLKTLPTDPRHNSKIERPKLAKWAAKQLKR
jgi:olefin beta-lactone synthetase